MISTIEIHPGNVGYTIAKYLIKDYKLNIPQQELTVYIRMLLWANGEKVYYSGQASGNE